MTTSSTAARYRQSTLDLDWRPRRTALIPQQTAPQLPDDFGHHLARLCLAIAEVAAGDRPARQLFRQVSPAALDLLARRARTQPNRVGPVTSLSSLRVARPHDGVIEVCAIIQCTKRFQALALELRRRRDAWHVTSIEIR